MLLAVDIGNSSISVGLFGDYAKDSDRKPEFVSKISADPCRTSDEYSGLILSIFTVNRHDIAQVDSVIVSSVVPQLTDVIKNALGKLTDAKINILRPGVKTGLNIRTDDPSELGSDIVANSVFAVSHYPLPAIIVDAGTATSVFAIDEGKSVIGGCIIPGLRVSLDALKNSTSQLPYVSLSLPPVAIGKNTAECIRSGIVLGHAMAVDGMIEKFRSEMKCENITVIATGGFAEYIMAASSHKIIHEPDMTLKGLCEIRSLYAKKMQKNQ